MLKHKKYHFLKDFTIESYQSGMGEVSIWKLALTVTNQSLVIKEHCSSELVGTST